jgi:ribonuclease BN (tRNA processing enzyme)
MKVIFVGVGEAFDENLSNTSILVLSGSENNHSQILLDCGFTAAHAFWRYSPAPLALDAIWISHFHGDHFFGLPLLLLRFWEEKRTRPLTIIGQKGIQKNVTAAMELAYPGFYAMLSFELIFIEAHTGQNLDLFDLNFSFALGRHSLRCVGIRLDGKNASMYYSGDGRPSESTTALARGCDLVIHEAYGIEPILPAHGSIEGCITFGRKTGARHLALVHMNRGVRKNHAASIGKKLAALEDIHAFLPAPGDSLTVGESPGSDE